MSGDTSLPVPYPTSIHSNCYQELTQDQSYHSYQTLANKIARRNEKDPWDSKEIKLVAKQLNFLGQSD